MSQALLNHHTVLFRSLDSGWRTSVNSVCPAADFLRSIEKIEASVVTVTATNSTRRMKLEPCCSPYTATCKTEDLAREKEWLSSANVNIHCLGLMDERKKGRDGGWDGVGGGGRWLSCSSNMTAAVALSDFMYSKDPSNKTRK